MRINEIEYLKNQLFEINIEKYQLGMKFGESKEVMGVLGTHETSIIFDYKTLISTFVNLCNKINYSIHKAIELTYNTEVYKNFDMFSEGSADEVQAYYYIENAIFRIATLWDLLAQIYNKLYKCRLSYNKIHYYKFFEGLLKSSDENRKKHAKKLIDYFNENSNDDYNGDNRWRGNHKEVNNYRNKMTHRNSPDETVLSNFDFNLKQHPSVLLRRVSEDYKQVTTWLSEAIEEIIKSIFSGK